MILEYIFLFTFINLVCAISKHPILIIVCYDGFPHDFDTKVLPKTAKLRTQGTYTDYLINVFPTKTYPNLHSIATGVYPDVHGVLSNSLYDRKLDKIVDGGEELFAYNKEIVPIWRRNEDMGDERYSGSMMWTGSDIPYQGKHITYVKQTDYSYDWFKKIDEVISWILDADKPANLVMLYFEEPDFFSHMFGTNSTEVYTILVLMDLVTQYLQDQLVHHNLTDDVNVIHLSDHGLLNIVPSHFLNITQYLNEDTYAVVVSTPLLLVTPKDGYEDEVYKKLKNASLINGNFKVYNKSEYLARWHFNSDRAPPILVISDVGYGVDDELTLIPFYAQLFNLSVTPTTEFGTHGYDYNVISMNSFFMARGPQIKKDHYVKPFYIVDLYNLFCKILEIPLTENNGTVKNINGILVDDDSESGFTPLDICVAIVICIILIVLICAIVAVTKRRLNRQSLTITKGNSHV